MLDGETARPFLTCRPITSLELSQGATECSGVVSKPTLAYDASQPRDFTPYNNPGLVCEFGLWVLRFRFAL